VTYQEDKVAHWNLNWNSSLYVQLCCSSSTAYQARLLDRREYPASCFPEIWGGRGAYTKQQRHKLPVVHVAVLSAAMNRSTSHACSSNAMRFMNHDAIQAASWARMASPMPCTSRKLYENGVAPVQRLLSIRRTTPRSPSGNRKRRKCVGDRRMEPNFNGA
jgi:hypothetical protein